MLRLGSYKLVYVDKPEDLEVCIQKNFSVVRLPETEYKSFLRLWEMTSSDQQETAYIKVGPKTQTEAHLRQWITLSTSGQ